ncbi:hypothetical protein GCM10010430_17250 [Kitasatospora cystarginea]|uniref:Uncharacterized protein n=1 Tax=Kitasatospora cystarginea TaxID=58350 RepID=A0ABN3DN47_9ACTN
MSAVSAAQARPAPGGVAELASRLIPDWELKPDSVDTVVKLPSFASKLQECERICRTPYSEIPHEIQDALVLKRAAPLALTVQPGRGEPRLDREDRLPVPDQVRAPVVRRDRADGCRQGPAGAGPGLATAGPAVTHEEWSWV